MIDAGDSEQVAFMEAANVVSDGYLVSVVTVSLNAVATIQDALQSVACQRADFAIEHLCIDGGSTDGTRDHIEQYAASNVHLRYLFEPDSGLFDAMNKGARLAKGVYILFLNADDFLASLTAISDALAGLTGALPDLVLGTVVMGNLDRIGIYRKRITPRLLPVLPRIGWHPPHQATFVKAALLCAVGGFDTRARAASDTATFYGIVRLEPPPSILVTYNVISFMRAGGASNGGLYEYRRGNLETFRLLRRMGSLSIVAVMCILVKISQKIFEVRFGRLPSSRWRWWLTALRDLRANN